MRTYTILCYFLFTARRNARIASAVLVTRAGNGSIGHGSWVKWVTEIGWVTWVMGH